jgi:hypothetical protein
MRSTLLFTALFALTSALPGTKKAAFAPQRGNTLILSRCSYPVYLWPVSQSRIPTTPITIKPKGSWHEPFHLSPLGGGTSLKFSRSPVLHAGELTQFEYTVVPNLNPGGGNGMGTVWYDGSNVDCAAGRCPFEREGVMIVPTDPKCPTKHCRKGESGCRDFYNKPTDNWATAACAMGASLTMVLCSDM